jgi:peptidase E
LTRRIVALGGGGFSNDPFDPVGRRLDSLVLSYAPVTRPRICFIPTASGDAESYTLKFYRAFAERADASDLSLFTRPRREALREFILEQHIVYVGGGNTVNMLAVWREHGLDAILRQAWESGVVMAGISAGMICWFASAATDSFGDDQLRMVPALGLLAGSACAHYANVPYRRGEFQRLIHGGAAAGIAADDGVALVYADRELEEAVSVSDDAFAYRVRLDSDGITEEPIVPRLLPVD